MREWGWFPAPGTVDIGVNVAADEQDEEAEEAVEDE